MRLHRYTVPLLVALLCLFAASAGAQVAPAMPPEPELPRTLEARPLIGFRYVDGYVKVERHFYRATDMAIALAGAFMQTNPTITVVGVGNVAMDVDTVTLAEAQAQGYKAYVGTAAAVTVTATCSGTARPWLCLFPLAQITSALSVTATRPLAVTAFVTAADGERESARATAPFVLQLAGPPVGPTFSPTPIRPPG